MLLTKSVVGISCRKCQNYLVPVVIVSSTADYNHRVAPSTVTRNTYWNQPSDDAGDLHLRVVRSYGLLKLKSKVNQKRESGDTALSTCRIQI